ncbi:ABC protein I family member 11 [Klebsormidium nitens]|uniref:ABC protein I family member 11 n=1 Tax=Klebsormidium nitens TaxID=105231 RepID=A0A1Y1IDJ7_KLENI|nr:ABC protein I family member 11 [Klebsormidium nitens]|eukprot:GAQ88663.1 ABC protein I family member 11 [Klebsormidium nitens]
MLDKHSMGLIFGRSGSGKTTLLQILAGLAAPTIGSLHIHVWRTGTRGPPLSVSEVAARTGLVFQFPERYFLADTVADELLFGHVRRDLRTDTFERVAAALHAVGMDHISMQTPPRALSDGYKRRLALAVQLIRQPDILLLDEPLAGLDWQARMDVVQLLDRLKRTTTLVVVSHDLRELAPLVDNAWRMHTGGRLEQAKWPLEPGSQRLELGQGVARS